MIRELRIQAATAPSLVSSCGVGASMQGVRLSYSLSCRGYPLAITNDRVQRLSGGDALDDRRLTRNQSNRGRSLKRSARAVPLHLPRLFEP